MMKKLMLIGLSITAGFLFTFFILNKKNIYAKEEYMIFAFQVGAFEKYDNAIDFSEKLPSSIIIKEGKLYKIYVALYNDIDIVNKMIVYFENNNINIYLRSIKVGKEFYTNLVNYEQIINSSKDVNVYNQVNQSILNLYIESINND